METKYPKYVSTNSDIWNSGDEAFFYVSKGEAKPLTTMITPIIADALEQGMLREATKEEIDKYHLMKDVEKRILERRFESGGNEKETLDNYYEWKDSYDKFQVKHSADKKVKEVKPKVVEPIVKTEVENTFKKTLTPQQNAMNQKPTISTKSF